MRFSPTIILEVLLLANVPVSLARYTWSTDGACDENQKNIILEETKKVADITTYLKSNVNAYSSSFANALFPSGDNYVSAVEKVYTQLASIADQGTSSSGYIVDITCKADTPKCVGGYFLHMDDIHTKDNKDKSVATMNFCPGNDKFFTTASTGDKTITATQDRLSELKAKLEAGDDMSGFLQLAHRSRAMALIHELTHTNFATYPGTDALPAAQKRYKDSYNMAKDFAYGLDHCLQLAAGTYNRVKGDPKWYTGSGPVWCGASKEAGGLCPKEVALINADSYAFLAAGVWFSKELGKQLPVPDCAAAGPGVSRRGADACGAGAVDPVDLIDDPTDQGAATTVDGGGPSASGASSSAGATSSQSQAAPASSSMTVTTSAGAMPPASTASSQKTTLATTTKQAAQSSTMKATTTPKPASSKAKTTANAKSTKKN